MTMLYLVGSDKDYNDSEQKQRKYDRRGKRKGIVQWDKRKAPGRSMEKVVMGRTVCGSTQASRVRRKLVRGPAEGSEGPSPTVIYHLSPSASLSSSIAALRFTVPKCVGDLGSFSW